MHYFFFIIYKLKYIKYYLESTDIHKSVTSVLYGHNLCNYADFFYKNQMFNLQRNIVKYKL